MKSIRFICFVFLFFSIISTEIIAQSINNEQKVIGTWTGEIIYLGRSTLLFNNNGTGSFSYSEEGSIIRIPFEYLVAENKIVATTNNENFSSFSPAVIEYFVSTDGRTLIILYVSCANFSFGIGQIGRIPLFYGRKN